VPVAGIPIQLIRTYDTRALWASDFGVGWSLDIRNVRVRDNGEMGLSWQGAVIGSGLNRQYCLQATKKHVVTVSYPMEPSTSSSRHSAQPASLYIPSL